MAAVLSLFSVLYLHQIYGDSLQEWSIDISNSASTKPFYNFWNKCVGSGHASLMLRQDWQQLLKSGNENIGFRYVRGHGILDDDVGSVNGINDYSFINMDKIYSNLLSINMKPYVEISFMPQAFASNLSNGNTVCHYKGNKSPPKDYNVWGNFIKEWVQHLVDVFGINEVSLWYFEVWNEPFGKTFWSGTFEEYYKLYAYTANAIKSVSPKLKVGGPALCCNVNSWLDAFLNYTFVHNISIDFVSWHSYPSTKEALSSFIQNEQSKLNVVKKYNDKYGVNLPVFVSEWNSACCAPQSGYDDNYNAAYLIYVANYFQQSLFSKQSDSMMKFMSYWSIGDVFEEAGFNSNEFNGLYGLQSIRGVKKPAFRAMELLTMYAGNVSFESTILTENNKNETVNVYCLNSNDEDGYNVFVANFNSMELEIEPYDVTIYVKNNESKRLKSVLITRIDADNANPIVTWQNMSSPMYPSEAQLAEIDAASEIVLKVFTNWTQLNSTTVQINLNIPVYGVAVLNLEYI